jgi:hypothetical protein
MTGWETGHYERRCNPRHPANTPTRWRGSAAATDRYFIGARVAAVFALLSFNTTTVVAVFFRGSHLQRYVGDVRRLPNPAAGLRQWLLPRSFLPSVFFLGLGRAKDSLFMGALEVAVLHLLSGRHPGGAM